MARRAAVLLTLVVTAGSAVAQESQPSEAGRYPGPCSMTFRYNGEGGETLRFEYDGQHLVRGEKLDQGETTGHYRFDYNEAGQLVSQETDRDLDGVWDSRVLYTYDEQGRLSQLQLERSTSGAFTATTYRYDSSPAICRTPYPNNNPACPTSAETVDIERGSVSRTVEFQYDESGVLTARVHDSNNDGAADRRENRTYDEAYNVIRSVNLELGDEPRQISETVYYYVCWQ